MLAHLVSFENLKSSSSAGMMKVYKEVRKELQKYDKSLKLGSDGLSEKEEIIILTKSDTVSDPKIIKKVIADFKKVSKKVFVLSLYDDSLIKDFKRDLSKILGKK